MRAPTIGGVDDHVARGRVPVIGRGMRRDGSPWYHRFVISVRRTPSSGAGAPSIPVGTASDSFGCPRRLAVVGGLLVAASGSLLGVLLVLGQEGVDDP